MFRKLNANIWGFTAEVVNAEIFVNNETCLFLDNQLNSGLPSCPHKMEGQNLKKYKAFLKCLED